MALRRYTFTQLYRQARQKTGGLGASLESTARSDQSTAKPLSQRKLDSAIFVLVQKPEQFEECL